ncbi:hypothetical protein [Terribacillus sp. JSM ZJ617]|uniref:hypothetical protein n=1 Tax=Terribacillus sp. JSM ZJ617 TaxID=3342119 RepID=UPI0035A98CFA
MENIDRILAAYGITPASVQAITSRLSKVQTHQAAFALKRSSLHPERLDRWLMVVQGKHNFYREGVPPVYQTLQENFYVVDEGEVYYLMPWLERHRTDEPDHPYEMLFTTLGKIHASSSKRYPIDYEAYALAIRKQKEKLQQDREELLGVVERFESQTYMGVVPLLVCTHYKDLEHVSAMLDKWYDHYDADLKADPEMEHSVLHGSLRPSHIQDGSPLHLLNWEKTKLGNPSLDLAAYYKEEWRFVDSNVINAPFYLHTYEEHRQMKKNEESLFMLHLLHPGRYLQQVREYVSAPQKADTPAVVLELTQTHRQLIQALQAQSYFQDLRDQEEQEGAEA